MKLEVSASALNGRRVTIVGGAGFIGSHFLDYLLARDVAKVTLYDNFSSGREWHYAHHAKDARLAVVRGNVEDIDALTAALKGHDLVIHLASNPDIARAVTEPDIDFWQGTALTNAVVESMRRAGVGQILYASGSGVYGDLGTVEAKEDHAPLEPVSTYGASKLAGETLISSYAHMFGMRGAAFRFGNVVGPRQTHGVGFDFARRLLKEPTHLAILGDGKQSKSYIHATDVVRAVMLVAEKGVKPFQVYNVATGDYITVTEIADIALECLGLEKSKVQYQYAGGDRGWKGDVPIVRLDTSRIQGVGWKCEKTSREALKDAILAMIPDMKQGRM
ncbi:MAG: NAD-dependent epimerase/dehydratase family protein [Myxococcales bacterium]|nr:NAD-dependent epimerase/dehydratase family protein [Myxococcales bacterium]